MNRRERRAKAQGAAAKRALPKCVNPFVQPEADVTISVCRSCSRRRLLFLPGRICGNCIESTLTALKEELADAE